MTIDKIPETASPNIFVSATQEADELMTFEEVWQEEAAPDQGANVASPSKAKTLVCFLSDPDRQHAVGEAISAFDPQTKLIFIAQNDTYQKLSPENYHISRTDGNTYQEVFQSIRTDINEASPDGEIDAILYLWPLEDSGCIVDYSCMVHMLQAMGITKLTIGRVLFAAEFKNGLEQCYLESWIGFERTLRLILPNTQVAAIYQPVHELNRETIKDWTHKLWAELQLSQTQSVLYQAGKRHVYQIRPTTLQPGNSLLKPGGTYLITGGCGGLGLLFAQYLAERSSAAEPVNLILTGRSPLDEEKQSKIKALEAIGSRVVYIQADVCNSSQMKKGLHQARERFGSIHGVIHAAGMGSKQSIFEKELLSFEKVLEPKIKGTLVLDELLKKEPLEFICYFSSNSAILGDFGSCDYAIANRFLMAYAHYRNQQQEKRERHGKAIAINWPLWKDGGMDVGDAENTKMYLKSSGQRILEAQEGLTVFERILTQKGAQYLVLVGQPSRVHRFLGLTKEQPAANFFVISNSAGELRTQGITNPKRRGRRPEMAGLSLAQCLESELKGIVNRILRIPREKIDREKNLADYGFNSVGLTQFAVQLIKLYGIAEITPALFFRYPSMEKLIQYFLTKHQGVIEEFYREEAAPSVQVYPTVISKPEFPSVTVQPIPRKPLRSGLLRDKSEAVIAEPIAIIGMSGRFPGARNIDELWTILATGQNMVREIPAERFDWRLYYGDPTKEPGKINGKWLGCIPGVSEFEPSFFEISPREAEIMDPRQRLLMQEAWKALEDAGYGKEHLKTQKIGMFVGVEQGDYQFLVKGGGSITSNNNSILASRLAYFLNLSGPVLAIDTACSSGLVAAYQAILSLQNGGCDTAIAAGVNLLLTPAPYIGMSQAGMLSEDGKSYTFDKRANGMVPGEAVAVVVLKRLSQAKVDGDPIYAVILGSGINYDGKTNGITAPNGASQTNLLKSVYDQYRINPEAIEYIVTHGTGTKLGDPVEINALYDAYKDYTKNQGYCALTSTKTNFGHTFGASGLVSLISLVQALRYEIIPASLNCEQENEYINWKESPFFVNKTNKPWLANSKPRFGAVSAFGMSGTNAHMVVRSYSIAEDVDYKSIFPESTPYYLLVLSAKTEESLVEKIKDLIQTLQNKEFTDQDLPQISYTLLEGRHHFNYRCAVVVQNTQNAIYVLQQVGGKEKLPNLFQSKVARDFTGQKAIEEYIHEQLNMILNLGNNPNRYQEILYALADFYCQGYEIDWKQIYGKAKPQRLHLATYPFVRESYWIPESDLVSINVSKFRETLTYTQMHPLLHQNTSDLSEQRYSSIFTGKEFFLADHIVKGQRVLPGVAYLEMAHAALKEAACAMGEDRESIKLKNVVWTRPIRVGDEPVQVHIGIYPEDNGELSYEIYSLGENNTDEAVVYSQGSAVLTETTENQVLDLQALQAECNQKKLLGAEIYNILKTTGLELGPGLQGIETIYVGQGLVMAKLSLPSSVAAGTEEFVLHPSMMDGALQASIGMEVGATENIANPKLSVPFALEELEVYHRCARSMWAIVRYHKNNVAVDRIQKLDIDICDEQGNVCVQLKGYTTRELEEKTGIDSLTATIGNIMLEPDWKDQAVKEVHGEITVPKYTQQLIILCEPGEITPESIENMLNGARCISLQSKQKSIAKRFEGYAVQVFEALQKILVSKPSGKVLVQLVAAGRKEQHIFTGLSGILKTAQLENPKILGQIIEMEEIVDPQGFIAKLKENSYRPMDSHIHYQGSKRQIASWSEVIVSKDTVKIPWKDGGIYLITGGAGGLGMIFAKEIVTQVKDVTLILTGRSSLSEAKQAQLEGLELNGAKVIYQAIDVTERNAVNGLIVNLKDEFGKLDGIIHSAGIISDSYIIKKTKEELQEVLAPKVTGLVNLDEASKDLSLDFMILFSSTSGSLGNPGQADYAAANAFMDAYAGYRNTLVTSGQRKGQTLSINWPLWQEGGMRVNVQVEKMMSYSAGLVAMRTSTGIQALYVGMTSGRTQVMVLEGDIRRIGDTFSKQPPSESINQNTSQAKQNSVAFTAIDQLREKASNYLKKLLSPVIKLPAERIETDIPMDKYGIDSIMVMELTNQLEKTFGSLSKTLFFEYQTIQELSGYFLESYREQLSQLIGIEKKEEATSDTGVTMSGPTLPVIRSRKRSRFTTLQPIQESKPNRPLDIAIIGLSGRYPQARNLQEFWKNLRDGKDCITEIPKERWDYSLYYDEDKNKPGKTYSKWGGFIDGVDQFDPLFFNISPREAEIMDPQERLFLECVYETLEDAGYTRGILGKYQGLGLEGNIGVYVGVMNEEYQLYGAQLQVQGFPIALSGNPSSIANRISYFCNFHGPSVALDTMCSSSLAAIHLACQGIQQGNCELAIAGGVNVSIHPNKYLNLAQGKFASSKGWCESFGLGGDGYVPGEGVGAILLKPLAKAIADEDQIYGVIKGSAINHGGKTNGYTVPNPNAQAGVIGQALQEAGINPGTISYIEAHGTGTSLGDPIEIAGLAKAFQKYTENKQFCAIGSAKSNIGHCESAAGIAGVTKVLLQLKNSQIVPSLHSEVLNPNIDFLTTPFIVQQTLTEWERPVVRLDGVSKEYPRIAGISSFGAGGANAHIVIAEYIPRNQEQPPVRVTPRNPAIIVLTARDEARLKERAQRLLNVIEEQQFTDAALADIAYTLQVGREAMEERLGIIAGSIEELAGKLEAFLAGQDGIEDLYRGQVKRNQETLTILTADEEMQEAIQKWIERQKYGKLLDLWVKGLVFDWNQLYEENKPRRISLPTYPFARERYWAPDMATKSIGVNNAVTTTAIHPLLHQNTSDLMEQRYSSTFTGKEFYLTDHIVKGQKVLPGVAYLEMARAAVEVAAGILAEDRRVIKLKNVVWARPIIVGEESIKLHIGLYPENNGEIAYEIYSLAENGEAEEVVYCQGSATLSGNKESPIVDLKALQVECNQRSLSATRVYDLYKAVGLDYGPGHQGIETIFIGRDCALAKLSIPSSVAGTEEEFVLHPSIMDGALQAAIGMEAGAPESKSTPKLFLPFALQELEVFNRCTGNMWAIIQYSKDNTAADKVQKLDIDICDEQGNVCVRLLGFTSRALEGGIAETDSAARTGSLMLEPVWKEQAVLNSDGQVKAPEYIQQLVILCEPGAISPESIETGLNGVRVLSLQSKQKSIAKRYQTYAVRVFEAIQKILTDKPTGKFLVQLVVASQAEQQVFVGLSGILKTAGLENPKVIGQIIEVETIEDPEGLIAKLKENSHWSMDNQVRYQGGKRQVTGWSEVTVSPETVEIPWKNGGVYLITGGVGGLGMIFAKEIVAEKVKGCKLVLTGRSPLNESKQAQLKRLESTGVKVIYRSVDVSARNAVQELIGSIREELGKLDGIIHCAGVTRDNYIIKKSKEELMEVLAPKVTGLVNLDEASKDLSLDFMILFSSTSGSLGNPGQADYATANAFMDAYARYRNALVSSGQRRGRTLSINWPLWQEGGIRVDETVEKMMMQSTGMIALRTQTGIRALYDGIASGRTQVMVMEGDIRQIRVAFLKQPVPARSMNLGSSQMKQESGTVVDQDLLREKVSNYLKKLLSPVIKLSVKRIETETPLEKYGIDSVMVMELTNQLEKTFGSLSKTLFFEYQTIRELSGYFLETYREQLNQLIGIEKKEEITQDAGTIIGPIMPVIRSRKRSRFTSLQPIQESKPNRPLDIAIIGVSGRYPQARNLHEYWQNLHDSKDCVTEIPKDRWDYSRYFDEDKDNSGKIYSKWGGFIDGVDQFDPLFFNIAPPEAEFMDPQERLFLECVYETLEDAGYTRETLGKYQGLGLEGNIGVFVGVMYEEYQLYGAQAQVQGYPIALSGNPASIANRVSYFCNFHGPSVAIDTMCSSSLTAIYLACQGIQRGSCELAIAGGVNVSIHPNKYLGLAQGKFASSKGRCESFGKGGDGYVPGEGVGAVLLKPLSKAIADEDHIYGIIKGTAINHGGKTNGFTVPNPNAQAGVIGQALQEAGINPRTISYIEAHGTGTSLGDPIEITGLVKAFQKYTKDNRFCAIGSTKSNIGHCESAAGISGITKVLLQLKNRQIVPSLHSKELNPNIDFPNTPFTVQQELTTWERPVVTIDGVTKEYPRIAGISSFGAGGSNAHVIIEEYIPKDQEQSLAGLDAPSPVIIVLSAKDGERIREQVERLLTAIKEQQFTDSDLANIAYTLQVGREVMEERLGFIISSIEELALKLEAFLSGQSDIESFSHGQVKRGQEALAVFTSDEDLQKAVESWINKGKYFKLLDLWVKGLGFDWRLLYGEKKPRRISLPPYPFAKERYWVPVETDDHMSLRTPGTVGFIHPLLQQNTSNLTEQRYSSTFTGQEFFFADLVSGQRVLPGVAHLEMARAAVEQAVGAEGGQTGIRLKDIVWVSPIVIAEEPIRVHMGIYPEDNNEIVYEIYSETEEDGGPLIYSQGKAMLTAVGENPVLDLKVIQAECNGRKLSGTEAYKVIGFDYDSKYQAIEAVYIGQGRILAKLTVPSSVMGDGKEFILHPSIMDAVLQVAIVMEAGAQESMVTPKLFLPATLQELEVNNSCTGISWAILQYNKDKKADDNRIPKLDIDLCDEQGRICVRLKGLETRAEMETNLQNIAISKTQEPYEMMTFEEVWQEEALLDADTRQYSPNKPKTLVCFLSNPENQQSFVETFQAHNQQTGIIFISQSTTYQKQSQMEYGILKTDLSSYREAFKNIQQDHQEVDAILYLWSLEDMSCIEDYSIIVHLLQAMAASKLKTKRILFAGQFRNGLQQSYLESWIGFERSLGLILPNTQVAAIIQAAQELTPETFKEWVNTLRAELQTPKTKSVLYQDGKRYICRIRPTTLSSGSSRSPIKPGGTYLITGGCGGLGLLFAEYLAKHSNTSQAVNLILTGRSPLDAEKQLKIKTLEDLGSRVIYIQADVSNPTRMKKGLNQAKEHFGSVNGVIHAAGISGNPVIFENEILKFKKTLEPKVKGTLVLDELLKNEPLDFICYFSSASAILGDFGSCDYAIANRFLMAYARYRNELQQKGALPGKTFVINWPQWKDGGMKIGSEEDTKMYLKSSGQRLLETGEGLALVDRILVQDSIQHMVFFGQPSRIQRFLGLTQAAPTTELANLLSLASVTEQGRGRRPELKGLSLAQCLAWEMKGFINRLLRIPRDKIDLDKNLADFGFNSINLPQLAILLIKHYGIDEITPALFFKYSSLDKLIQYFLRKHQPAVAEFYREAGSDLEQVAQDSAPQIPVSRIELKPRTKKIRFALGSAAPDNLEPIAIIGMSGRFPGARNIEELWTILANGQDMVQEIPIERFDWRPYYSKQIEPGKTICKWCGCIPGVSEFEPLFFEISPKEAETMDPRQRLLLQEAWRSLEDAGYGTEQIKREKIGMFVGVEQGDYQIFTREAGEITANSNAILAARLAYFLNLNGPVMAIDTACSSGLVAAHQAILNLHNGECDTAIVAGVNLLLTPEAFIGISQSGMLSEDGKCFAFDKRANGLVPGEAVAVVILKRLSRAEVDGDPIYAVIKGSGINYDGKTNGITAPSGVSQTNLLKTVYEQHRVNPEEIEYIITHGTGTKLGDSVEINALSDAFKDYTKKEGYCALTSTKTNFGHTFTPSGLVSLISLVQALRYETIPASLHCEQENDFINWKESPFYVNKANRPWPCAFRDGGAIFGGRVRTGAVSAFGMSGTNAHIVVQSYSPVENETTKRVLPDQAPYYLLVFSAKTEESLEEKIKDMIKVIQNKDMQAQDLSQICYTLLEGRQHFNHRCAIVVQDREDSVYVLKQFGGKEKLPNLFRGNVPRDFTGQEMIEQYVQDLLTKIGTLGGNKAEYQKILYALADFYCQGYEISWKWLYKDVKPQRIHLPTYPFMRESYWVAEKNYGFGSITLSSVQTAFIHPLLQQNTSNLSEQRFSSTFTGEEFFIKDYIIEGRRGLPGAASLEMARVAVTAALDSITAAILKDDQAAIYLKDIIWDQPLLVGEQPVQVNIQLFPESNGEIVYQIYSSTEIDGASTEPIIYCQGSAVVAKITEPLILDLNTVKAKCNQGMISSAQIYNQFKTIGIEYGLGYQAIEQMYIGAEQVLAKLSVPSNLSETQDLYILHPSLLDAALQAATRFMMGPNETKLFLPGALERLEILSRCTSVIWAVIRYSQGDETKVDIALCDDQGTVLVKMKGYSSRGLTEGETPEQPSAPMIKKMLFQIEWKEQDVAKETPLQKYDEYLIILCEMGDLCTPVQIQEQMGTEVNIRCLALQSKNSEIDKRFQYHTIRVFEEIQTIFRDKLEEKILIQIVYRAQGNQRLFSALSGLFNTARIENPQLTGQLIEIEPGENTADIAAKLKENRCAPADNRVCYQAGKRLIYGMSQIEVSLEETSGEVIKPWKDRGIYLITGGAGGLGLIFAKEIAGNTNEAVIILTGRSLLNLDKQARIKEIEAIGAKIVYEQVDVTDKKGIQDLVQRITKEYGGLNGIIHSAGFNRDSLIINKTKEEIKDVLAPKVTGLINLDETSRELNLDFFILFSSRAAVIGNPGQADYATANAFLDTYAGYRNSLVASNQRHGRTLAINWPFWKEGGMQVDAEIEKLWQTMGMVALETQTGIRALYQGLLSGNDQVIVVVEDYKRIEALNPSNQNDAEPARKIASPKGRRPELRGLGLEQCLEWELKYFINRLLKIPREKIDNKKNLTEFGFNSIGLTQFAIQLNKHFGIYELTPASFFRYSTIEKLIQFFLTKCQATIEEFYWEGVGEPAPIGPPISFKHPAIVLPQKSKPGSYGTRFGLKKSNVAPDVLEPIAIIGMSGRFPNADTIEELWNNLINGKNCLTEIPKERWDWRDYYGDPLQDPNKTDSKWGGFIRDIDCFDPLFFEIGPKEAEYMDPRQRLFLEEAWHCLEDAGYMGERIQGKQCGVYVGVEEGEYGFLSGGGGFSNSNQNAALTARIAYKLDLKGPNLALTATCSSGLVAVHQACQALRQGDCEMALVGGVALMITPMIHIAMSQAGMNSPDGKCYVFDQRANGMVPSEAVAVVLLKPLSKAVLDQDHIYGCIKASGVNYNGKSNGITAPNPMSQAELMIDIYDKYHINSNDIQYIIPHSMGTLLGDPIEIEALTNAFSKYTTEKQYCAIGTIKPLIGHTFAASGVVSLICMVMAIKNQTMLALHNYETSNEYINFSESPFIPNKENKKWTAPDKKTRMGIISTTGNNGTNAHAVIEEYVSAQQETYRPRSINSTQIIVLSAKNQDRLSKLAQQILEFIEHNPELSLIDFAYTLQVGREAMPSRCAMVIKNREELIQGLKAYLKYAGADNQPETLTFYTGDLENEQSEMRNILAGKIEDTMIELLLKENNPQKIANYWAKGGEIPWESLHQGEEVRRISLPTYPFAKERYWATTMKAEKPTIDLARSTLVKTANSLINATESTTQQIQNYIIQFLAQELKLAPEKFRINKNIVDYGVNSIMILKLTRNLENNLEIKITGREMLELKTIESLVQFLAKKAALGNRQPKNIQNPCPVSDILNYPGNLKVDYLQIEALEKFKNGVISLEEVKDLIKKC